MTRITSMHHLVDRLEYWSIQRLTNAEHETLASLDLTVGIRASPILPI